MKYKIPDECRGCSYWLQNEDRCMVYKKPHKNCKLKHPIFRDMNSERPESESKLKLEVK